MLAAADQMTDVGRARSFKLGGVTQDYETVVMSVSEYYDNSIWPERGKEHIRVWGRTDNLMDAYYPYYTVWSNGAWLRFT